MFLFETDSFKNRLDYVTLSCGDATVINRITEYPNLTRLYLSAELGKLQASKESRSLAYIFTEIKDNSVYIVDFLSRYENLGNGKKLFFILLDYIFQINKHYHIEKISGFISKFDFDHWSKLFHFYGSLNDYVKYVYPMLELDFRLRKYEIENLKKEIYLHTNEDIYFDIFITYS